MIAWINQMYVELGPGMQAVLTATWQAAVLILIVLAVQASMGRWLSPRWRYALWSVVVIRLMMPVAPGSVLSVFNLFKSEPMPVTIAAPLPPISTIPQMPSIPAPSTTVDSFSVAEPSFRSEAPSIATGLPAPAWGLDDIALAVWLAGMATVLLVIFAINATLMLRLRRRAPMSDPGLLDLLESCKRELRVNREVYLYEETRIASPALAGVFRPSLLIPPGLIDDLSRDELRFVLLHELAHVKKHDIAQNWLLIVLSSLHWFNPIIWFAFARLRGDRELARDAMVLNATGTEASQAYGQTIIRNLERITSPRLQNPALAGIGDGMGQLKRRLRMIALAPKRRPALTLIGVVLLATLATIGLTDASVAPSNLTTDDATTIAETQVVPGAIGRPLHFPGNKSVGTVYSRPEGTYSYDVSDAWQVVGEAIGEVTVPHGHQVRLDAGRHTVSDLSFLAQLEADDLWMLSLWNSGGGDDMIPHIANLTGLRILDIRGTQVTSASMHHLRPLAELRSLKLNRSQVGDEGISQIADLPNLELLWLGDTPITDGALAHIGKMPTIKSIILDRTKISDAGLGHLREHPTLERISFYENSITDDGLAHLSTVSNLSHLSLDRTNISDAGILHIAKLDGMKTLQMYNNALGDVGVAHLTGLAKLESLSIDHLSDAGARSLSQIPSLKRLHTGTSELTDDGLAELAKLSGLEELNVGGRYVTDKGMEHISKIDSLKVLLIQNSQISDAGLAKIAHLPNLERLLLHHMSLKYNGLVTYNGLQHLSTLPRLNDLHINGLQNTEAGLVFLADLPHLIRLNITDSDLDDRELAHLAGMRNLKQLILDAPLSDVGLRHLAPLRSLEYLDIGNASATDSGLEHLAGMVNLESLAISGQFSDTGLKHLERLSSLKSLFIASPGISSDGLLKLQSRLPSLQQLIHNQEPVQSPSIQDVSPKAQVQGQDGPEAIRGDIPHQGTVAKHEIKFEFGKRAFAAGDDITISQITGTRPDFGVGGTYTIKGKFTLQSQHNAMLSVFTTSKKTTGPTRIQPDQTVEVARGSGSFKLTMTIVDEGYPHISFYPYGGGSSFGGVYFGLGETLQQKAADPAVEIDRLAESKKTLENASRNTLKPQTSITVSFNQTPLENAVHAVRGSLDVPLFINWPVVELAGINRADPVTLSRTKAPADVILLKVLEQASDGGPLDAPAFEMIDGVLNVSTVREKLKSDADTRVYDIRHLLFAADAQSMPLAPRADGTIPERPAKAKPSREELVGQIATLIRETVGYYKEWEANGGDISSIEESNGNLIVKTSSENHEGIKSLLSQIGEARDVQISIESMFLILPDGTLEASGVGPGFTETDEGVRIAFLDDRSVNTIKRAAGSHADSLTLAAPRILQISGQPAHVLVSQDTHYIADYEKSDEGGAYEPVYQTVAEGVRLNVQATVSSDRRQVTATLRPSVSNVAHPVKKRLWADSPADKKLYIETPEVTKAEQFITVSMPDRAALLVEVGRVSGPMAGADIPQDEVEEGVERHVYMLIKPTIILEAANENAAP